MTLRWENELKDQWIESLWLKIEDVVNNEHKEKRWADEAEFVRE